VIRTVPRIPVEGLDDLARLIETAARRVVLVFDADNTLVPQGAPLDEFRDTVGATVDRFARDAHVDRVIVLTNGPDRGVPGMVSRGNKPWTSRRRLGIGAGDAVVVVGDQALTDGILAWRLRGTFVHLAIDTTREAARQALMRRLGRSIERRLFTSPAAGSSGPPHL
jgi:predicted HAD superfamily phosphohydrolase YqeG